MKQTFLLIFLFVAGVAYGQQEPEEEKKRVIQFSGVVVTQDEFGAVSYTHLTLPTKRIV